jgi:hypothetical protein
MKENVYKNRNLIKSIAIITLFLGGFIAFNFWGIEPQETISGVLCGVSIGILLISFSLKN